MRYPYVTNRNPDWNDPSDRPRKKVNYVDISSPYFDINNYKGNEIPVRPGVTYARIPRIKQLIRTTEDPEKMTDVELVIRRYRDEETGETKEDRIIIGYNVSMFFPGFMKINESYYRQFFDEKGRLKEGARSMIRLEVPEEPEENPARQTDSDSAPTAKTSKPEKPMTEEPKNRPKNAEDRTVDEIREDLLRKEKALDRKLKETEQIKQELLQKKKEAESLMTYLNGVKEQYEEMIEVRKAELEEREERHLRYLDQILDNIRDHVRDQAKKKPATYMSARQIRMTNDLMKELQGLFAGTVAEDYLHLADEPIEEDLENHPGTTYGEMDLILASYSYAIDDCLYDRLYYKDGTPFGADGEEEDEEDENTGEDDEDEE